MTHTTTQSQQIQTLLSWADEQQLSDDIFPRNIDKLLSLTELNLHSKSINYIAPEIRVLQNLKILYLSNNKLVSLPEEIGLLKNLEVLWIQSNELQSLPSEIMKLSSLKDLVAFDNRLETLPKRIADMPSLQSLFLHSNCLDQNIINSELNSIKADIDLSIYKQNSTSTRFF